MKTLRDKELGGKRVLVRVDYNVPLDPSSGAISDDTRLRATLPTLNYLIQHQARIILCSHLGRPQGKDASLSLAPVAQRLSQLLGKQVRLAPDSVGPIVEEMVARLGEGEVLLLENIRFHPGEEKNDPALAQALARLADLSINDAFSVSHRAHASTVGITQYLPAAAGFLLEKEVEMLGKALHHPQRPFATLLGGAKVKDKIGVLSHILERVDRILIGGGMAGSFIRALGYSAGNTPSQEWELCRDIMNRAQARGVAVVLPRDVAIAPRLEMGAVTQIVSVEAIPSWGIIGDIGPQTVELFSSQLRDCRTVLWNGPMGVFELPPFAAGTRALAHILAQLQATTIVGGGSTTEVVQELGLASRITHVSTGGGASLEFLEGKILPGIAALEE